MIAPQQAQQATILPTGRPDEYRLAFPAHPAKQLLERQRQKRLAEMAKKKAKKS